MDDQRNYPTDDAEKLRLLMLQLDEAAREAVFATIRELAAEGEKLEQATTVTELFQLWRNVRERQEAASDDTLANAMAIRAFIIEQRAVALPLTSARDVLALIVMTSDAPASVDTPQDALVARAYAEMDAS
ncbi:MAG: hypothetical protein IOC80_14995 [Rhodobacter sp.]|nr:hypothetical protein [Rhodobacter sp.]MCA3521301.1 hypothetical protein [Rhodobacter sp.]MCA3523735.1 hypothetical protein [Rhodobacter sp.]MCA3530247.1 hypothetical protein [Rhodobacter sp.]MCA3532266.1 hypothetical protein [Rhodobacter sp.]